MNCGKCDPGNKKDTGSAIRPFFLVAWTVLGVESSDSFWNHIGFKKLTPRIHFETAVVSMPMKLQSPISPLFVLKQMWFQNESEGLILSHRGVSNCIRPGDYFLAWWHPPGCDALHVYSDCLVDLLHRVMLNWNVISIKCLASVMAWRVRCHSREDSCNL